MIRRDMFTVSLTLSDSIELSHVNLVNFELFTRQCQSQNLVNKY